MKSTIVCLISSLFFANFVALAQQPIPVDAENFYKKAMSTIHQKHINWIKQAATNKNLNEADICF